MEYSLIRSRRKTCAIYVREGAVEVRAPLNLPKAEIDRFVLQKRPWIDTQLSKSVTEKQKRDQFCLNYGDFIRYRGQNLPIIADNQRAGVYEEGFCIPPNLPHDDIKTAVTQIYRHCAKLLFSQRVESFAAIMGITPPADVKISSAATRWGSCTATRRVRFAWRLIMADDDVIDYVVVHELAHLSEMNHGSRFWELVQRVLPDYKVRKAKLRTLERELRYENW